MLVAGGITLSLLPSCRPRAGNDLVADSSAATSASSIIADSVRGIVVESGAAPNTTLLLQPPGGDSFVLRGALMPLLRRVVGLDIVAEGRQTGARDTAGSPRGASVLDVQRFVVRAVDGVAAHDGIVTVEREQYSLLLQGGRKLTLRYIPELLRAKPGARVFLAGPLDRPPLAYGVISESR